MSSGLIQRWATETVPPNLPYPLVLRTPHAHPLLALFGVSLGVLSFMVVAPLVMLLLAGLYWALTGAAGDFEQTYRSLIAYELPFGLVVGHLGLVTLIPISAALVLLLHRVRPGYLSSVLGRLRWRWFGLSLVIGAACLMVILVAQNLTAADGPNWDLRPQSNWWVFLAFMVLTTPLQAAAEEYFFRGYLMQALGSLVSAPWFGIVTSAAMFTLFHNSLNPALIVDRFAFGVLAGVLVWATGGLEAAIAAHVVNNVASFTLGALTSSMAEIKAVTEVTWVAAGWDVARFALFVVVIWWVARRVDVARLTPA
ncbi:MAG: lysostaphin resistance A-like protein [Propioniciclava sp.]